MRRLLEKHHRAEQMWILSLVKNTTLANLLQKNNNIFFLQKGSTKLSAGFKCYGRENCTMGKVVIMSLARQVTLSCSNYFSPCFPQFSKLRSYLIKLNYALVKYQTSGISRPVQTKLCWNPTQCKCRGQSALETSGSQSDHVTPLVYRRNVYQTNATACGWGG